MNKVLLLGVCSFLFFNDIQAGKFKEVPFYEAEGQTYTNKIVLQFDDDEGRREVGATIEIGRIDGVIDELNISIEKNVKKGHQIAGIDFSNTDLINEELGKIVKFLISKLKDPINYLDLSDTHTDATKIDDYTKDIPLLLGYPNEKINQLAEKTTFYMPLAEYYGK